MSFETALGAERDAALAAHEARRSLQLVIGRLEEFAGRVRAGLDGLDWHGRREIIRALVRRIEIDREEVEVVFRIPGAPPPADGGTIPSSDPSQPRGTLPPNRQHRGRGYHPPRGRAHAGTERRVGREPALHEPGIARHLER